MMQKLTPTRDYSTIEIFQVDGTYLQMHNVGRYQHHTISYCCGGYNRFVSKLSDEQVTWFCKREWLLVRLKRVFSLCGRLSARKRMRRQSSFAGCYSNTTKRRRLSRTNVSARKICNALLPWFFSYKYALYRTLTKHYMYM